jgi:hypothetical protein
MRGVCDELPLRVQGRVEPREQRVDHVREFPQVVVWSFDCETLVQVRGGDP